MSTVLKMSPSLQLVVFTLDGRFYALDLVKVQRVVRAVEVTPLPQAPAVIRGVVNIQGELFAVVDLRQRFHLPEQELGPADQFILVNLTSSSAPMPMRKLALIVDSVVGIQPVESANIVYGEAVAPGLEYVQGVARVADDLILIHDLERCLSLDEARMLDHALTQFGT